MSRRTLDAEDEIEAAAMEQARLVLPAGLQDAVRPAEALLEQGARALRRLGVRERLLRVHDAESLCDEPQRKWIELVFGCENSCGEQVHGVARQDRDGRLRNNRARVEFGHHKMHAAAGNACS